MSSQLTKSQLRRKLLKQRQSLSETIWREKSDRICEQLNSLSLFQEAKTILAYFSIRQEPDLSPLFSNDHQWGFSRCVDQSLVWHSWQPGDSEALLQADRLQPGVYGILEPHADAPQLNPSDIDLILVPSVACDYQGYRLGYGGGFYDRLLNSPQWQDIPTIGIVFDFAYLPQLPVDSWDQPLQRICTESIS